MSEAGTSYSDAWAQVLGSKDGVERQTARESLVAMGRGATSVLTRLLTHVQARVRWEAAMALKEVSDPASAESLVVALGDEDGDVRWVAAEALGALGRPAVAPLLRRLVREADSFELRDAAHVAISLLRDPALRDLLSPLYRALKDGGSPEVVMSSAGEALAELEGEG